MTSLLEKEAAQMVANHQHDFTLAKKGQATELAQLREDLRTLQHQLATQAENQASSSTHPPPSPAFSGKIRSLNAQVQALQKRLRAAMATNKLFKEKIAQISTDSTPPAVPSTPIIVDLQDRVASQIASITTLKQHHLQELEAQAQDRIQIVVELHFEIEALHAEHAHDVASTQSDLQQQSQEVIHLNKCLAKTSAKAQQELADTHRLHQMALDTQASSSPPAVVADLRSELSAQFHKISHLNSELTDLKQEADDYKMSLSRAQTDYALLNQRYHAVRSELSSIKVELFQSQEVVQHLTTETSDLREDLAYQSTLVEAVDVKTKARSIKHNEQRLLIKDLREALHTKGQYTPSTTSVGCQTLNITVGVHDSYLRCATPSSSPLTSSNPVCGSRSTSISDPLRGP